MYITKKKDAFDHPRCGYESWDYVILHLNQRAVLLGDIYAKVIICFEQANSSDNSQTFQRL